MLRATLSPRPSSPDSHGQVPPPTQIFTRSLDDVYTWAESVLRVNPESTVEIYEIAESIRGIIPSEENRKNLQGYTCTECGKELTVKLASVCAKCRKEKLKS